MIEQFIQEVVQWVKVLPPVSIYLVFFLIAYFENIIPPIPGDVLVAFGGYLAAESVIHPAPVLLLTTGASVMGFMSIYLLGSRWGSKIQEQKEKYWLIRFIPLEYINTVKDWMSRWGQGVVLANRFLAGTRSVISLTAGISHTRISYTIISSTVSSLLWNGILLSFGWIVHENWKIIGEYLSIYGWIILSAIILFAAIRVSIHYYRKKKSCSGSISG